jgi:endonuclease III
MYFSRHYYNEELLVSLFEDGALKSFVNNLNTSQTINQVNKNNDYLKKALEKTKLTQEKAKEIKDHVEKIQSDIEEKEIVNGIKKVAYDELMASLEKIINSKNKEAVEEAFTPEKIIQYLEKITGLSGLKEKYDNGGIDAIRKDVEEAIKTQTDQNGKYIKTTWKSLVDAYNSTHSRSYLKSKMK